MKITILSISDSDKHFSNAILEYKKRISNIVDICNIKPVKSKNKEVIKKDETDKIISLLTTKFVDYYKVLLSFAWKSFYTEKIYENLKMKEKIVFVIWWPYWLNEDILEKSIDLKLSFWKQTMPHWLVKLVLIEQIYRLYTMTINKKYHY